MAAEVGSAYVTILPSARGFRRALEAELQAPARDAGRSAGRTIADGITPEGERAGRGFANAFTNALLPGLGSVVESVARIGLGAGAFSVLAAGAASAATQIIGLGAALAPAAGIVAALPAAALLSKAAFATLQVAVAGVGDAFKAALQGDAKKFAEALEELSPAARTVALEFQALVPRFEALKNAVQDGLFAQLPGQLTATADVLLGPLQQGMTALTNQFGRIAAEVLRFGQSAAAVNLVRDAFSTLTRAVGDLESGTLQRLLQAMARFVSATLPAFSGLGSTLNDIAKRFTDFLNRAVESGKALEWIRDALSVFKQLGGIARDVAGIFKAVFQAMQTSGANALGVLGQILGKLNEFANSAEGQQILVTIFRSLAQVGQALSPIFSALGGALAQIAPHIANIATALGPGLAAAVRALGPALAALGPGLTMVANMLAKAFADPALQSGLLALGQGLSAVLSAVAPLLPVIAQLAGILGQALGLALQNLAGLLGPVITALADALRPALISISDAFTRLAPLMTPIYEAFGQILGAVVQQLLPPILNLVPALLDGLVPAFVSLLESLTPLLPTLTSLAVMFIEDVMPALVPIIQIANLLAVAFIEFGATIAQVVAQIRPAIDAVVAVFTGMSGNVLGTTNTMITGVRDWFQRGVDWVRGIVAWFGQLPGMIGGWLQEVVVRVRQTWSDIRNAIAEKVESARAAISSALDRISSSWTSAWANARSVVSAAWDNIRNTVSQKINEVLGYVQSLPGRIASALGNMGSLLHSAGRDLVVGFYNGIISMWNWLVSQVQNLFGGLAQWAKSILGIASPSKVFAAIGREIPAGMAVGIDRAGGMVEDAIAGLTNTATVSVGTDVSAMPAGAGGISVAGDLVLPIDGLILDLRKPDQAVRQFLQQVREGLRDLERETVWAS